MDHDELARKDNTLTAALATAPEVVQADIKSSASHIPPILLLFTIQPSSQTEAHPRDLHPSLKFKSTTNTKPLKNWSNIQYQLLTNKQTTTLSPKPFANLYADVERICQLYPYQQLEI
jgi:hypothetical protein